MPDLFWGVLGSKNSYLGQKKSKWSSRHLDHVAPDNAAAAAAAADAAAADAAAAVNAAAADAAVAIAEKMSDKFLKECKTMAGLCHEAASHFFRSRWNAAI